MGRHNDRLRLFVLLFYVPCNDELLQFLLQILLLLQLLLQLDHEDFIDLRLTLLVLKCLIIIIILFIVVKMIK